MNIGNKKTIMAYLKGDDGKSAYQIWLDQGNTGTEADFLESLKGPQGPAGEGGGELPEKTVFVQGGDFTEIASGTVIKKGQVVKFVVTNYLNESYDIYTAYGQNGEEFSLISNKSDGYDAYGWKSMSSMGMPHLDNSAEVYIEVDGFSVGEYSFVYNGEDITISSVSPHNYINGYVGTPQKAVYEDNGEIKPLTTDMIEGNSGGESSGGSSVEVITVDDCDNNYESVWIPLKGHNKCYILPFERHNDGLTIIQQPIYKYTTLIRVGNTEESFTVVYHEDIDAFQISPIFYQGSSYPITVILFD